MEEQQYDIIIIGAGPAGSTAATILAKAGFSVLVLEKEKFPREHVGESLLPFCYHILEELGVLEEMKARFTRKPGVTFSNIDGSSASHWCFRNEIKGPSYLSFHVRRSHFDQMLLQNSLKHGAKVIEEVGVKSVDFESSHERVTVHAIDTKGAAHVFNSRFVVDASGQSTLLARQLKMKKAVKSLNRRVAYSTHWLKANWPEELRQGHVKIVHLEGEKLGWLWMIPLKGDRLSIGVALNMDYAKQQQKVLTKTTKDWIEALYLQEIKTSPIAAAVIEGAQMLRPLAVNGDFSYTAEQKFGDRFAIVGDASGFLDPIFSSGIYLALKSAEMVSKGIVPYLREGQKDVLVKAYEDIAGGYRLVERLINIFYDPGSLNFAEAGQYDDLSYEKLETAFSLIHLILAGDFFSEYDRYLAAVETLRDVNMIEKYKHLIGHHTHNKFNNICELPEDISMN